MRNSKVMWRFEAGSADPILTRAFPRRTPNYGLAVLPQTTAAVHAT
jgi:hypothetical protein